MWLETSGYLRRYRSYGTFNARWAHAAFHGTGLGLCLGVTGDILGQSQYTHRPERYNGSYSTKLGGATSRVGDPTGRLKGREQVHSSIRKANMASMHMQLKKLGSSIEQYGRRHGYTRQPIWKRALLNNNTWWNSMPFIEVLRDLGSYMRLGPMLGRDT
ncbi:Tyrosine--tRNA ligase [Penicillium diatomitis]|uniref:Tyrosine--tRNA ligase n=1 Tax=Penicillium diatomitis TaxID=2819901 RepID=A0A9X0BS61_9EURO|nr:Tyrosine--tRNA ligase [Penicillium diatomitis]KAJ5480784.1 Tyrosine--tRNA ligase [Penicillium diatomitis]